MLKKDEVAFDKFLVEEYERAYREVCFYDFLLYKNWLDEQIRHVYGVNPY